MCIRAPNFSCPAYPDLQKEKEYRSEQKLWLKVEKDQEQYEKTIIKWKRELRKRDMYGPKYNAEGFPLPISWGNFLTGPEGILDRRPDYV